MIHEQVLPAEYRDLITGEINKILRNISREKDLNYYPNSIEHSNSERQSVNVIGLDSKNLEEGSRSGQRLAMDAAPNSRIAGIVLEDALGQTKGKPDSESPHDSGAPAQDLHYTGREVPHPDKRGTP